MEETEERYQVEPRNGTPFRIRRIDHGFWRTVAFSTTRSDAELVCRALNELDRREAVLLGSSTTKEDEEDMRGSYPEAG